MKIISVIVDELPEMCAKCGLNHECVHNFKNGRHPECKLRVMPSDAEIDKQCLKCNDNDIDYGWNNGVNWLKSKLT